MQITLPSILYTNYQHISIRFISWDFCLFNILFSFACFVLCFVFTARSVFFSPLTNKAKIETMISLFGVFVIFSIFVYVIHYNWYTPIAVRNLFKEHHKTANLVFFSLFVFLVPVTFVLLLRDEKLSSFFCFVNFFFLFIVVNLLINTGDFIGLLMGYELLYLPAFFILRKTAYSAAAESAYSVFTVWSVLGSLVVVFAGLFVLLKTNVSGLEILHPGQWTDNELWFVSFLFFIGFGVKIPIWPFHYWLTRVHVEASTGFSIFLSGFLVKAAVFVCWKIIYSLGLQIINPLFIVMCLFSAFDAVVKLFIQVDLKKLVAFATVFEMGLIFLFLLWKPSQSFFFVFIFSFSHAFLSGLMFYLVDTIFARTKTRSLQSISGLSVFFPKLSKFIWSMLFIFWGLPLTLKFFVEFWVLSAAFVSCSFVVFFMVMGVVFLANIAVTKAWLHILYGSPTNNYFFNDLTTFETAVGAYLFMANVVGVFFFFI